MTIPTPDEIEALAGRLLARHHPAADFAIAGGSLIRGDGAAGSDLDLVVLYPSLEEGWRESMLWEDRPVELFIHDPSTLQFFVDADIADGHGTMPHLLATGRAVPRAHPLAARLQSYAAHRLAAGPPPLTAEDRARRRYFITDTLDDLTDPRPLAEAQAALMRLYDQFGEFALRDAGVFVGVSKHRARGLARHAPELAAALQAALAAAFAATGPLWHLPPPLAAPLQAALQRLGGPLFAGYRASAGTSRRAPARWPDAIE